MKKFYSLSRQFTIAAAISLTLFTTSVFGQICGPIVEDFNNTSGSTAGFTGDFILGTSGGGGNTNGFLTKSNVSGRVVYSITTPTYRLPAATTSIGIGFQLSGTSLVGSASITLLYVATNTGQITQFNFGTFVPGYTGTGSNITATVCQAIDVSSVPFFPTGGNYRFVIELTSNSGNGGANDNIVFDNFRTTGLIAQAALPVTFMGFDAKKASGGIQLTWKVAGEENVNRYEVERSLDGRTFTSIAKVATDKTDTYTYFDPNNSSTVYYRIRNVDNDGKFKYSTIARLVNGKSEIVLKAFPQPVLGQLTIQHPVITDNALVTVTGADGRIVKTIRPTTGSMQTFVDMTNLQKGMYLVRYDAGDGKAETMKVVKQ